MASKLTFSFDSLSAAIVIGAVILSAGTAHAVELHPAAVIYKLPDQIEWKGTGGNRSAVLVGDPDPAFTSLSTNGSQATTSAVRTFTQTTASSLCSRARGGLARATSSILPIPCL